MDNIEKNLELLNDFPPVSVAQWEEKIIKDLKGADYNKKLMYNSPEGYTSKPYYTAEDFARLDYLQGDPGKWPYVRGKNTHQNSWLVREDIVVDDVEAVNKKVLDILMKGVDSIGFILDEKKEYSRDTIDALLKNIHAHGVELNFYSGISSARIVSIILQLVKDYNRQLDQIRGSVDFDPLGRLITKGNFYGTPDLSFQSCKALIELADHLPNFQLIAVNAYLFREAGAGIVQELAFALSQGNEYLSKITSRGLSVTKVAPRIKFNFGIGSDYFLEIAKLRAARFLWANIVKAYGGDDETCSMNIHARNIDWNKTIYDPHVNMLRTTTEAMSAIIGGVDSLTVQPYNSIFKDTDDFARRIARNQQLLLKEESYLDQVIDPAAGSYYIEELTNIVAEKAWELFRLTEEKGGFIPAVRDGFVQDQISADINTRREAIETRKRVLLGTNQYPNYEETLGDEISEEILQVKSLKESGAIVEPLSFYRGAQIFEELRHRTEVWARDNGKTPVAFLLTAGNVAMRRARAMFSGNFFACAGFSIEDNSGFNSIEEGIEAARKAKPEIVVLCGADEDYAVMAPKVFEALHKDAIIVVAGYPKDIMDVLKKAGLEHFIHVRSNAFETLRMFQQKLGIL